MRARLFIMTLLLALGVAYAQENQFRDLIGQGIRLHDEGQYTAAIEKSNEALEITPDSKQALYEITLSYAKMGDYAASIATGHKALASADDKPNIDLMLYVLIGSNYRELGQPEEAIKLYDQELNRSENSLLYFNKGLTYQQMNKLEEALENYKKALSLEKSHEASHLNIARIYAASGDAVSAFLYYTQFLLLEPRTERSQIALQELFDLGEKSRLATFDKDDRPLNASAYNKLLQVFEGVYSMKEQICLTSLSDDTCASYASLFFASYENGHKELLCEYLTSSFENQPGEWLEANADRLDTFFVWLDAFGQGTTKDVVLNN